MLRRCAPPAISVAHHAFVQHIHHTFPHLIDSRSLSCFARNRNVVTVSFAEFRIWAILGPKFRESFRAKKEKSDPSFAMSFAKLLPGPTHHPPSRPPDGR